ncbi:MAG: hypothetical protein EOO08_08990 [Chitinophagaceae bacterium]|nr:MAG: hypothetical protein EOO08_08990 [Chitinophagaceae bacterium]
MRRFFGELKNHRLQKEPIGIIAEDYWNKIPQHFPFVRTDEFILMPNHVHGILHFDDHRIAGKAGNAFGPQSCNLGSVIRNYKGAVTSFAKKDGIAFAWHPRFYDRILHTEREIEIVRNYIRNNPLKG